MSVRWASLGGWSFASRSFSWDAEGETRLPEVLSQVLIKGASGFHLRGGTVCQFIFQILLTVSHSFSLSPLCFLDTFIARLLSLFFIFTMK